MHAQAAGHQPLRPHHGQIHHENCTKVEGTIFWHVRSGTSLILRVCFCIRMCCLEHLNLSYCEQLTDLCLEWISSSSVSSLDISGCNVQDRVPSERLFSAPPPAAPSRCFTICTPACFQGLVTLKGAQMRKLVLVGCRVTDIGIEVISQDGGRQGYPNVKWRQHLHL